MFGTPPLVFAEGLASCGSGPALGLPASAIEHGSRLAARVQLGRHLFSDAHLSGDGTVSCATCHEPEHAFTDGRVVARGIGKRSGTRNTPSLVNAALQREQFWDGRRGSIEAQVFDPLLNANEHGLADRAAVVRLVRGEKSYAARFQAAFGASGATGERIAAALAAYVHSLAAGDSPFDRYAYGCDSTALSQPALRGLALFRGRAQCSACHTIGARSASFTDNDYHSAGVGLETVSGRLAAIARHVANTPASERAALVTGDAEVAALGRFVVTLEPADIGKFRTPSLRNVAETAPYMHDGSVPTLEAAVNHELYYRGQALGRPIVLTPSERQDIVSFLRALTSFGPDQVVANK